MNRGAKALIVAALLWAATNPRALAVGGLFDHGFATRSGQTQTLRGLDVGGKQRILVSFWAKWCGPCREELRLLAEHKDELKDVLVVALSVDDATAPAAAYLDEIQWPFAELFDAAGSYFYSLQSSGELPLSLAFDAAGVAAGRYAKLTPDDLKYLASAFTNIPNARNIADARNIPERSEGSHLSGAAQQRLATTANYVELKPVGDSSRARVFASSTRWEWAKGPWSAQVSYEYLRQKRFQADGWERPEDEIGPTFVERRFDAPVGPIVATLGDTPVYWLDGVVFAARIKRETNERAYLRGALVQATSGIWNIEGFGGIVRDRLYDSYLDPSIDLSPSPPRETVRGLKVAVADQWGDGPKIALTGAMAHYRENSDAERGYLLPVDDQRLGLRAAVTWTRSSVDAVAVCFKNLADQGHDERAAQTLVLRSRRAVVASDAFGLDLEFGFLRSDSLPQRVSLPQLVEYPFVPLTTDAKHAQEAKLEFKWDRARYKISPGMVNESSDEDVLTGGRRQTVRFIAIEEASHGAKVVGGETRVSGDPLDGDGREGLGSVEGSPLKPLHLKILTKSLNAHDRTTTAGADWQWERPLPGVVTAGLGCTATMQSGHYRRTSGIDSERLRSWNANLRFPHDVALRTVVGQEPGGVICTGGTCSYRPPVNGSEWALEGAFEF